MTTVLNFVCDRTPDQNGCRFIECENEHGESIKAGEWRLRSDGLVELRVELPQPGYTAVDMANAARDERRGLVEHLTEQMALKQYPEDRADAECAAYNSALDDVREMLRSVKDE